MVTVEGEISNFRPSSTGHLYFSLKDKDALLAVAMFKNRLKSLNFSPEDGMQVKATGSISVYPQRGTYQLICENLTLSGQGAILAMLEERKRNLAALGLFDQERKKKLPLFPARVAVVTSPTGAAIRDIIRVLRRRNAGIDLVVLPAPVQGDEAAPIIASQIEVANLHNLGDVLIVGRGGGSLEDLLPFYSEEVVKAIAASQIPVISAVGHEIDFTFSDLAADLRAPTPSAAAEMVSACREDLLAQVQDWQSLFVNTITQRISRARLLLTQFTPDSIKKHFEYFIQSFALRLDDAKDNLLATVKERLTLHKHRLELLSNIMESHSPLEILKRGFAVVTKQTTGEVVRAAKDVEPGERLAIKLYEGKLTALVQTKEE